eukprot:9503877-Pyramimonas_sp.AAC.2
MRRRLASTWTHAVAPADSGIDLEYFSQPAGDVITQNLSKRRVGVVVRLIGNMPATGVEHELKQRNLEHILRYYPTRFLDFVVLHHYVARRWFKIKRVQRVLPQAREPALPLMQDQCHRSIVGLSSASHIRLRARVTPT